MSVAAAVVVRAFVHVGATAFADAIAFKAGFAPANPRSDRILAGSVIVATAVIQRAFVDVGASFGANPVTHEPGPANAEMAAFGVAANRVGMASAGEDSTFVNVRTAVEADAAAFVTGMHLHWRDPTVFLAIS